MTTTETTIRIEFENGIVQEFDEATDWLLDTMKAWRENGAKFTATKVTKVTKTTEEAFEF